MCGIAGILRLQGPPPRPATIRALVRPLEHRGPDGEGVFVRDRVALGHRRLSIIDLDGGGQPMSNEDASVWITYNGELYNFKELRSQLLAAGHVFRTHSDTEVVVHAYEEWGTECVRWFRGMFAFAIADFSKQQLFVARDHLGIKPLYLRMNNRQLAFASEIRPLVTAEPQPPQLNPRAIDYFLRYRYIPHPDTAYQEILKLPPAHYQLFDFDGRTAGPCRYWRLSFQPDRSLSSGEWLERFNEVVHDSVRSHLVADVPFGAFLSGGVDSTLVAMEMQRILDRPVKAYTIGFSEDEYSEIPYAQAAARELGVELCVDVIRPDVVGLLDELVAHYGEPFADTSAIPTWCVSRLARSDVPMVLSGDGGDEAFAGYHRYELWMQATRGHEFKRLFTHPRRAWRQLLENWNRGTRNSLTRWQRFFGVLSEQQRRSLWRREYHHETIDQTCPAFAQADVHAAQFDRLAHAQGIDIETYLPGDILTKVDVASMCHGLEVRTPLTDIRVIEFAATLPIDQRRHVSGGQTRLKALPKRALAKRFDERFVHREKMGFAIPELEWLRQGSPVRERLDDLLASQQSPVFDFFEPRQLRLKLGQFDEQQQHHGLLWSFLILGIWLDQNRSQQRTLAA